MIKHVMAMALTLACVSACTDPNTATRVLESEGYSQITIKGYDWFACSEDDMYHTRFHAVGPSGKPTEGTVCSGLWFRGSTVRLH